MIKTTLTLAFAVVALVFSANVNAQDCGCSGGISYGAYGVTDVNDCGRGYTNQQAASLWAGYCTETCTTGRQGCGLFKGGRNAGGCGDGCSTGGFGGGCFGYPSGGGCNTGGCSTGGCNTGGCGGGCLGGSGGNLFSKLKRTGNGCANECGNGCNLFSKIKSVGNGCGGRCGGGCNLFSKLKSAGDGCGGGCNLFSKFNNGCGCNLFSKFKGLKRSNSCCPAIDQCGCGNNGQYFNYAVGAEYGTAGMQSNVSGVLTGACCGGATVIDAGNAAPAYGSTPAAPIVEQTTEAPVK